MMTHASRTIKLNILFVSGIALQRIHYFANTIMVGVTHLTSPAMLATSSGHQLSVMSYNVLLPNSVDGWWNYKMYYPPLTGETLAVSSWEYRKELLRKRIGLIGTFII
jgi:mRNA deadenylase 3'-5' endonuclease subunit Ccr4